MLKRLVLALVIAVLGAGAACASPSPASGAVRWAQFGRFAADAKKVMMTDSGSASFLI